MRLGEGETRNEKFGRYVTHGSCFSPILFNCFTEHLAKEVLGRFGDFKIGQEIRTVKYSDDLVLLAKEETALKEMIYRINKIGKSVARTSVLKN